MRARLSGHLVVAAESLAWGQLKNGALIESAERDGYEVLIAADQSILYQQINEIRTIALVVLSTNSWRLLKGHADAINAAVLRSARGSFETVSILWVPRR